MPTPTFRHTQVDSIASWFNFHHTIANRPIPLYLTPDGLPTTTGGTPSSGLRQAAALSDIIGYCLAQQPPERLCVLGAKWSLSDVLDPANVALDPGAFNRISKVEPAWLTPSYLAAAAPRGGVPVVAQGGTQIAVLNQILGQAGLAIQTSGAADGHRIAGCIATGTHGSALGIGAVHDTVLAMFLVTGPGEGVLVQPATRRFTSDLAGWFRDGTGLTVRDLADDDAFAAAQVALGSLGFVHSVVLEAVPLYQLTGRMVARPLYDPDVWRAIESFDFSALDPRTDPYNFGVNLSPYATGSDPGAFVSLLWKQAPIAPFAGPSPATTLLASDTSRCLSALVGWVDSGLAAPLLEHIIVSITQQQYKAGLVAPLFPGQVFGPTSLPPGNGRSTELAVDHADAGPALRAVLAALRAEASAGRHLIGVIGVRFVPQTSALLGMNIHAMTTFIELPSLGSSGPQRAQVTSVHEACWAALRAARIPFTCHWGQEYGMDAQSVGAYYGGRVARWKAARAQLLPTAAARTVFSTPLLSNVGLAQP